MIMKRLFSWIGKILYNRNENVYLFHLPMQGGEIDIDKLPKIMADDKEKITKLVEANKKNVSSLTKVIEFIKRNMKRKTVEFSDYIVNYTDGITYYILGTDKNNPFFVPLFYEIYAYSKLKDPKKFSYKYETLIFNEITVLKFAVKCYGKK
jgi:hypothetical protein